MIIETILNLLKFLLTTIFGILPDLPDMPAAIADGITSFLDIIFDNVGLLGVFIPISTIKVVIPIVVLIMNFDDIYKLVMFIIKKIPMLGVE